MWCVPALRVPLVHSLINHFRQKHSLFLSNDPWQHPLGTKGERVSLRAGAPHADPLRSQHRLAMSTAEPGEWPWDQVGRLDSRIPGHGKVVTESMAKLNHLLFKYGVLQSLGKRNNSFLSGQQGKWEMTVTAQIVASSDELQAKGEGASEAKAVEEAARQLLEANNSRLLHLLAECEECEAQQRLAPTDSNGDCASFVDLGPVVKFKPKVGSVVQAIFNPDKPHFQPAHVVTCDDETCGLRFFRYTDVNTIPITDIRPLASAMPRENELLFHVIIAQVCAVVCGGTDLHLTLTDSRCVCAGGAHPGGDRLHDPRPARGFPGRAPGPTQKGTTRCLRYHPRIRFLPAPLPQEPWPQSLRRPRP